MAKAKPHFILIGNYPPDGQESMQRFTDLLASGLTQRGYHVSTWLPRQVWSRDSCNPYGGINKWLGYLDKWVLFPRWLKRAVQQAHWKYGTAVRYHICDHSNAPYLAQLPPDQTAITCHDVLAIRGALGAPDAYCSASRLGVILQRWILKHLRRADRIGCVSQLTLRQLVDVAGYKAAKPQWTVVHNAFNADFKKLSDAAARHVLARQNLHLSQPFLLHVGSNLPRKNRRMLLQMVAQTDSTWPGHIVFAGQPVDAALCEEARRLGLTDRVHSVTKPDHETLCALYSLAHAFVFPSFSEGFGWPIIEAQACGTPVIASQIEPLPEVSGGAALHADPHAPQSFAAALKQLEDATVRQSLVAAGYKNTERFGLNRMIDGYLALHGISPTIAS